MGQDQSRAKEGQAGAAAPASIAATAAEKVAGTQGSTVATVPLAGVEGFQVVRLLPYSPAHKAGLVPYFDIITSLDHVLLETEGKPALQFFKSYVANHRDQPVCFTVFNLHIRAYRDVYCVPSDAWGGGGLLGCSIEWSRAETCPERCVHVVDVLDGSPAAHSGELKANRDYIIGMQTAQEPLISLIKNEGDFYSRIEGWHEEQRWTLERRQRFPSEAVDVPHILLFLVYNSEANTVKEVAVEMGTHPEAALGMSVATGLLHIIPSAATAGSASTAFSLPVMNKFVRVEENEVVENTLEAPPPPPSLPLAPAPSLHSPAPLEEAPQQQQQQLHEPHAVDGSAPQGQQADAPPAPPPPVNNTAAPVAPADQPPPYPPVDVPPLSQLPPYEAPPFTPDTIVPPPREAAAVVVAAPITVGPPVKAVPQPPPTPPTAAQSTPRKKNNSFRSAFALLEAYENPQSAAAAAAAAPPPPPQREQHAQETPAPLPPTSSPPVSALPRDAATAAAAAAAPPPPPPPQHPPALPPPAAQPSAGFSMTNMPPPLHFPVFPGAALKRQQK